MTPTYMRNAGIIFMALGAGQLLYALCTGQMEGVDSLSNLVTGQYSVPPTFTNKPIVFLLGVVVNATSLAYGCKLIRKSRKEAA